MSKTVTVSSYTRRKPEKKPDPLAGMIEARKAVLSKRYTSPKPSSPSRISRTIYWIARIWGR